MTSPLVNDIILTNIASLRHLSVPPEFDAAIARHRENLENLATSMLAGGIDHDTVNRTIDAAFQSYRSELISAIRQVDHSTPAIWEINPARQ